MNEALQQQLAQWINRNSLEKGCDMPDYAIAAYLASCYEALCAASSLKTNWRQKPLHCFKEDCGAPGEPGSLFAAEPSGADR